MEKSSNLKLETDVGYYPYAPCMEYESLHLPQKSTRFVGKYAIHGASGLGFVMDCDFFPLFVNCNNNRLWSIISQMY